MPTLKTSYTPKQSELFFGNDDDKIVVASKGRRFGGTRGAINAYAEWCIEGKHLLWGDTINANINRYVDRFLIPLFKDEQIPYHYNRQDKQFMAGRGFIDFRSADRPENWEGFGYDKTFLNEAGIILQGTNGRYLYENAVLPMSIDNPNSQIFAVGTPKGKTGKNALFFELSQKYKYYKYSTYDNTFLSKESIDEIVSNMPSFAIKQEIYGEFVDIEGSIIKREWLQYGNIPTSFESIICGVDTASTANTSSDYTAIAIVGYKDGKYYVLDVTRDKLTTINQIANLIKVMVTKWNCNMVTIEKTGQLGLIIAPIQEMLPDVAISTTTPNKDKFQRFMPVASRYENLNVIHSEHLPHYFTDELLSFTGKNDTHDDMIDALSIAFSRIVVQREYRGI
jgi:predicted phage terminase large subunit-like protein